MAVLEDATLLQVTLIFGGALASHFLPLSALCPPKKGERGVEWWTVVRMRPECQLDGHVTKFVGYRLGTCPFRAGPFVAAHRRI
jgi:hypothetical protein